MASPHDVPQTPSRNANAASSLMQPPPILKSRNYILPLDSSDGTANSNLKMPGQLYTPAWLRSNNESSVSPAITPADRRDTSLRMIHHDMKACLEKFSDRLNTLISVSEQNLSEIKNSGKLLATDHEKTVADIIDVGKQSSFRLHICANYFTDLHPSLRI